MLPSVRSFGAIGDGVTDDRAAFLAADASGPFTVEAGTYFIGANMTLNNDFSVEPGGVIASASTITVGSAISAGEHKIFAISAPGRVDLHASRSGIANSAWWGSRADFSGTNDAPAINSAIASNAASVVVPAGCYKIGSTMDFTPWSTASDPFDTAHLFDAPGAKFIQTANLGAMVNWFPSDGGQLLRHTFRIGKLIGSKQQYTMSGAVKMRHISNCKIEIVSIQNGGGAGMIADQSGAPAFGCFNNIIEVGDIADHNGGGFSIFAALTGSEGFEGNIVRIGRIGFNGGDGVTSGNVKGCRSIFNTFILGPIEHNQGYGIYERGGGNQWVVNNTNSNAKGVGCAGSTTKKSAFSVYAEDGIDASVSANHRVLYSA